MKKKKTNRIDLGFKDLESISFSAEDYLVKTLAEEIDKEIIKKLMIDAGMMAENEKQKIAPTAFEKFYDKEAE
jgi:hypothetical protein